MSTSTSPIEDIAIISDNEEPIAKNLIE